MPSDFVIFTRARSGSNSLMSRLDSCPDVTCHGEIFKRKRIDIRPEYRRRLPVATVPARNADPGGFVAGLRALDPDRHVGFKIFPPHLETAPGAIAHLVAPATRRIVLVRAPLETYASGLRMKATGVHKLQEGDLPPPGALDARVRFTRKGFRRFHAAYNRFMVLARTIAAIPGSFVIHYEQINDAAALDALLGFVGSEARAGESRTAFRKQHAGGLAEGFENWDELQAFLKRAAAVFLDPPPPSHPPG
jgi:hypothetical protein